MCTPYKSRLNGPLAKRNAEATNPPSSMLILRALFFTIALNILGPFAFSAVHAWTPRGMEPQGCQMPPCPSGHFCIQVCPTGKFSCS